MRILKVSLTVVALAAPLTSVRAQTGGQEITAQPAGAPSSSEVTAPVSTQEPAQNKGWNGTWALLFQLNNILANQEAIGEFGQLGVGAEYFLSPDMAARLGVSYYRQSNPVQVTKNTDETAGNKVVTYTLTGKNNSTSVSDLNVRADFLYRLMSNAVAPYVGAGLFVNFGSSRTKYKDDVSVVDQVETVDNKSQSVGGGLRGLLGAEWRLHPSFSIFAEYALSITVVNQNTVKNSTTTEVTAGGEKTVHHVASESKTPSWMSANTGLTHAGQLGIAVHF